MHASKTKFPRQTGLRVARDLTVYLAPHCERIIVAGSLRRLKREVGDVEIVFIPRYVQERDGLFDVRQVSQADRALQRLLDEAVITKRRNSLGSEIWGEKNKLARHTATGMPVDFFSATAETWCNYLVCRTGSAETNTRICMAAQRKGWKWHPYGSGFTDERGRLVRVESEADVFRLAGLEYLGPKDR